MTAQFVMSGGMTVEELNESVADGSFNELVRVAEPHSPFRVCPLRGLPDDFLVFAVGLEGSVPTVCGLCCAPTTLTVRFEDVWQMLPPESRAYSYMCTVIRDPHSKDEPSAQAEGVVRESIPGLAPDVRICLDLAQDGGFVLSFHPEQ